MWVLDPDGDPRPIWAEPVSDRVIQMTDKALKDEEQRKADIENAKVDRLPYWLHPEADYVSDGSDSGMNNGDRDDNH